MLLLAQAASSEPSFQRAFLWPLTVALIVSTIATPIVRAVAMKIGLYDRPDGGLKPHQRPIPYLGGVAIYFGWLAALAWALPLIGTGESRLNWIALAGTIMMLTGLIDDIRHLSPKLRLAIQFGVAALLVYGGIGRNVFGALTDPFKEHLPALLTGGWAPLVLSGAICGCILAGATNATNLIDGLDGLCGGIVALSSLGFLAISTYMARVEGAPEETAMLLRGGLCVGIMGACLGFLLFNFNPASIFMGDSGSLLLGFNAALLLIFFAQSSSLQWLAGGLMVFAFPIFDTGLAITRRWLNGRPLFRGDRSHFYDQLRDRGLSVRQTVMVCYFLGLVAAALGAMMVRVPMKYAISVLLLTPVVAGLICWRQGMLKVDDTGVKAESGMRNAE